MVDLDEYSAVLADIDAACRAQKVPSTTALAEYGPGQFEVNLMHCPDPLLACDQAMRFRRIVKCVSRRHGMDATFLPKPYADMAGSGLHVHVSLNDAQGRNVFASENPLGSAVHAARGSRAAGRPWPMAWRCSRRWPIPGGAFAPRAYVPLTADWSINNRGAALRVPVSDAANRRLEHRVAGAEANPYLVMSWILGGILKGLDEARAAACAADRQCLSPRGRAGRSAARVLAHGTGPLRTQRVRAAAAGREAASPVCAREAPRAG